MSEKLNNLFIVLVIASPLCSRVCSRFLPIKTVPSVSLLSWEEVFPVSAPSIPDRCLEAGLCTNADNYPTELVSMLMTKLSEKNITKFTRDQLYENEYSNNLGEILELCETKKEKIVFPRAAKDQNGEWQFILNMPGHPFQSFRVHECLDVANVSCSAAVYPTDMVNFSLQCEQQFTKREMVYLNLDKKVVSTGQFLVPSCCSCYLEPR